MQGLEEGREGIASMKWRENGTAKMNHKKWNLESKFMANIIKNY